jgi:predicted transglutaminase-like cysteine proteinase
MADETSQEPTDLPESQAMPASGWIVPPKGWQAYAAETHAEEGDAPASVTLTQGKWDQLWDALGKACTTPYHSDVGGDLWEVDWQGDCEDKCLAMRQQLVGEGWPMGALRLVLCETETGEDHCVLSVETNRGVFVLDERAKSVVSWRGLPYTWLAREYPGYSVWQKLSLSSAEV